MALLLSKPVGEHVSHTRFDNITIDRDAMAPAIGHPAKGEPYVVAVDAINDLNEEGVF